MANQLIVLTVLVLLPLVPAFLLFKLLPSRAVVKGPLAGFNVALGGAFAGYVTLTVFVATYYAQNLRPQTYRTWTVSGQLQFPGPRPQVRWDVGPPMLQLDANNAFYFKIPVPDGAEPPDLLLEANGYPVKSIQLSSKPRYGVASYKKTIDTDQALIEFQEPIVFERPAAAPVYHPMAANTEPAITGGG